MTSTLDLAAFRRLYRGYQTTTRPHALHTAQRLNVRAVGFVVDVLDVPGTARPLWTLGFSYIDPREDVTDG